ncbi:general stress protein [Planococcus halocryophilus Or1]|uniref:YtxH domain-containing protein n=1 Tax=Planococcus halocryophilus TaxID=1215089 RepID=UPI0002B8A9B9|nr:YtxH domain-containing protein [Planococcus halocryophilus]EMF47115.1 general stress protein [Planococcus halocryophilus Or1]
MSRNKDQYNQSNGNDSQNNQDYYTQGGQYRQNNEKNYQQSDYVPQSYGASNRYDDLYDYEESSGGSSFLVGILVGGVIGAAAALFLAPKTGKELQADLKTQATTLKEKASQQADFSEDGAGFAHQLKEQSTKVVEKVKNMKAGNSPMDDGTASSEGEESIDILSTVQNTQNQPETKSSDEFTSTANALKQAVEEVKEEKNQIQVRQQLAIQAAIRTAIQQIQAKLQTRPAATTTAINHQMVQTRITIKRINLGAV